MSRYLSILAVQRPFPIGTDELGRVMFSCNYEAEAAAPVEDFEQEIVEALIDADERRLATPAEDTFIGRSAAIPKGDGPYVSVIDTGGTSPGETHDGAKYERLSFQIVVRGKNYQTTRDLALEIWRELDGKRNVTYAA